MRRASYSLLWVLTTVTLIGWMADRIKPVTLTASPTIGMSVKSLCISVTVPRHADNRILATAIDCERFYRSWQEQLDGEDAQYARRHCFEVRGDAGGIVCAECGAVSAGRIEGRWDCRLPGSADSVLCGGRGAVLRLAVENPAPVLTPAQVFVRLACRSFLMATLQAGGVWLIAEGSLWAGLTGFLISYNWIAASRAGNDNRIRGSALAYGVGGSVGTLTVLLVARYL